MTYNNHNARKLKIVPTETTFFKKTSSFLKNTTKVPKKIHF